MLVKAIFGGEKVFILDITTGKIDGVAGTGADTLCVIYSDVATGTIQYSLDPSAFTIVE